MASKSGEIQEHDSIKLNSEAVNDRLGQNAAAASIPTASSAQRRVDVKVGEVLVDIRRWLKTTGLM